MNADFFTAGFMGVVVGMIIMLLVLVAVAYWPQKKEKNKSVFTESDRELLSQLVEKKRDGWDRASIVREQLSVLSDGSQTRASSIDFIARDILAHEKKISADDDS